MPEQTPIYKLSRRDALKAMSLTGLAALAACSPIGELLATTKQQAPKSTDVPTSIPPDTPQPTDAPTSIPTDTPVPPSATPVQEEFDIKTETLFSYHFLNNSELDTIIGIELDNSSSGFTNKLAEAVEESGLDAGDLQPIGVKLLGKGNSEKRYLLVKKDGSESFMYVEYIILDPKAEHSPDRLDIMPPGKGDKGFLMPLRDYPKINNAEGILTEDISLSQEFVSIGSDGNSEKNYSKVVSLLQMIYDKAGEKIKEVIYKDPFTWQQITIPMDLIDLGAKATPTPSGPDFPTPGPFTISVMEALETVEPLFPAEGDRTIRLVQPKESADEQKKELPYGITKPSIHYTEGIDYDGVDLYLLSGILLGYELEGDKLIYRLGIPDYNTGQFREFTVIQRIIWRENVDPNGKLRYAYTIANKDLSGGFNLDGKSVGVPMEEALPEIEKAIGTQIAFKVYISESPEKIKNYFDEVVKPDICKNVPYCVKIADEAISRITAEDSDIFQIISALKSNNPAGYEGKELPIWVGITIIPKGE